MNWWVVIAAFVAGLGGTIAGSGIVMLIVAQKFRDFAELKRRVDQSLQGQVTRNDERLDCHDTKLSVIDERVKRVEAVAVTVNIPLLNQQWETLACEVRDLKIQLAGLPEVATMVRNLNDYVGNVHGKLSRHCESPASKAHNG